MEICKQRAGGDAGNIDLGRGHEGLVPAVGSSIGVRRVIPLVGVSHRHNIPGKAERRTRLVASHLHPPVVVCKTPAGPLGNAVIVREAVLVLIREVSHVILAVARYAGGVHRPPFRAGPGPCCFTLDGQLIHGRTKLDTVKVLKVNRHLKFPGQGVLPRNTVGVGQCQLVLDALGQGGSTGCRHRENAIRTGDVTGNRLAVQRQ